MAHKIVLLHSTTHLYHTTSWKLLLNHQKQLEVSMK